VSPAFAIEPEFGGLYDGSGRDLLRDFVLVGSGDMLVVLLSAVDGIVTAGGDILALNTGSSVETPPCSDAMWSVDLLYFSFRSVLSTGR